MINIEHPDITASRATGYPSWYEPEEECIRCCECGRIIPDDKEVYECNTHATLCEDCLKLLHKKYV